MSDLSSALHACKKSWAQSARPVLVLGDIMLDEFYYAQNADRNEHREYEHEPQFLEIGSSDNVVYLPGGAAAINANLRALDFPQGLPPSWATIGPATYYLKSWTDTT